MQMFQGLEYGKDPLSGEIFQFICIRCNQIGHVGTKCPILKSEEEQSDCPHNANSLNVMWKFAVVAGGFCPDCGKYFTNDN